VERNRQFAEKNQALPDSRSSHLFLSALTADMAMVML